jgi:hypothetical protein
MFSAGSSGIRDNVILKSVVLRRFTLHAEIEAPLIVYLNGVEKIRSVDKRCECENHFHPLLGNWCKLVSDLGFLTTLPVLSNPLDNTSNSFSFQEFTPPPSSIIDPN